LSTDHILTSPAAEAASRRAGGSAVPRTASPFWLGIGCAIASIVVLVSPLDRYGLSALDIIALATLAYAAPGVIYEYVQIHGLRAPVLTRPLSAAGLRFALLKAFGFSQIVLAAYVVYASFPEYTKANYTAFHDAFTAFGPAILIISALYFIACQIWLPVKRDFYWYIGRYSIIVFLARVWTRMLLRRFALAWLVKLFFLPIMIGSLSYSVEWFASHRFELAFSSFYTFFDYYWELVLAVDVVLAIVGYIFSLRLLGTAVVATDETWRGWVATLICYFPFSAVLYGSYLTYEEGYRWGNALAGMHIPYIMYGLTILFFHTLYLSASLNFGIRYSNLSHRGILTDGLFRFTKHPAYLFKNIVWWLVGIPFITTGSWIDALHNCAILLCVNAVYWWRARTEEYNLSRDPAYVAYALSMNERSICRFIARLVPALAYRPPKFPDPYPPIVSSH
jgi:isoprenylcysteine carboxyl methyltransferase (ICMT) family protein YpbQ